MNKHNLVELPAKDFIAIIEGENRSYIGPYRSVPRYSWEREMAAYRAAGLKPEIIIYLPTYDYRDKGRRDATIKESRPPEFWPDFEYPIINRVTGYNIWQRGLNTQTGEGQKTNIIYGIDILEFQFEYSFIIKEVKSDSVLHLKSCEFFQGDEDSYTFGKLVIEKSSFKNIKLDNIKGLKDDQILPINEIRIIELESDELHITNCNIILLTINCSEQKLKKIIIKDSTIETIDIKGDNYDEIQIVNIKNNTSLIMNNQVSKFLFESENVITDQSEALYQTNNLKLSLFNQISKGDYIFKNVNIGQLLIEGASNNSILLKDCIIDDIQFENVSNVGEFRFHNIKGIRSLLINDTSLGKAEFLSCEFEKAELIKIKQCNISEIVLIDTVFPKNLIAESSTDYRGIKEIYRQLKSAAGKQGDRVKELDYESLEMGAYTKDVTVSKNRADRFILWSNEWSNNHGQDPEKALCKLIFITLVSYFFVKVFQGFTLNFNYTFYTISEYLNFALNPLYDYDKIFIDPCISP